MVVFTLVSLAIYTVGVYVVGTVTGSVVEAWLRKEVTVVEAKVEPKPPATTTSTGAA